MEPIVSSSAQYNSSIPRLAPLVMITVRYVGGVAYGTSVLVPSSVVTWVSSVVTCDRFMLIADSTLILGPSWSIVVVIARSGVILFLK